jgi:predicted nucleic acid-binding Zn ribbon protein
VLSVKINVMVTPRREKINWGRWRVQQERAQLDSAAKPPLPTMHVESLDRVMPNLMRQLGAAPDFWQEKLTNEWPQIAGPAVTRHTRPGRLEGVSLTVYVTNSVWLRELKQVGYKPLLEKLQAKYGAEKIRHLKLQLDPDAGRNLQ